MSHAFYPSDEYDSSELELQRETERERTQRRRPWLEARGQQDEADFRPAGPRPNAPWLDAAAVA